MLASLGLAITWDAWKTSICPGKHVHHRTGKTTRKKQQRPCDETRLAVLKRGAVLEKKTPNRQLQKKTHLTDINKIRKHMQSGKMLPQWCWSNSSLEEPIGSTAATPPTVPHLSATRISDTSSNLLGGDVAGRHARQLPEHLKPLSRRWPWSALRPTWSRWVARVAKEGLRQGSYRDAPTPPVASDDGAHSMSLCTAGTAGARG